MGGRRPHLRRVLGPRHLRVRDIVTANVHAAESLYLYAGCPAHKNGLLTGLVHRQDALRENTIWSVVFCNSQMYFRHIGNLHRPRMLAEDAQHSRVSLGASSEKHIVDEWMGRKLQ